MERLEHMRTAIQHATEYSKDITLEDLANDKMRYFAIVKNVEIVGEAAYMLSREFKESHPDTPWKAIEGMRHFLVHGYYQVSDMKLWNTLQKDIPPLKQQIETYIDEGNHSKEAPESQ